MTIDQNFAFLGKVLAYGGGSAAVAYLLFQYLGKTWIENKFAERLEQLRHSQALELQRLRVEIDSMLSGALKIRDKEFEVLPEAWIKLDEAYGSPSALFTHSRVRGFIEDLALLDGVPQEEIALGEALAHLPGCTHDHVNRKVGLDTVQDFSGLAGALASESHNDEQIDIGIFACAAPSMRSA